MKVTFLQHLKSLRPGRLQEYVIARHQAVTSVLSTGEISEDHEAIKNADLVISLGHPTSVDRTDIDWIVRERRLVNSLIAQGRPLLGICFGAQMIAAVTGGSVSDIGKSYVGWFENDEVTAEVWRGPWFRFHIAQCHPCLGSQVFARSQGIVQAFQFQSALGLQFHPEMDDSIVQELEPNMMEDFHMGPPAIDSLIKNTRERATVSSPPRDALFDEVLERLLR